MISPIPKTFDNTNKQNNNPTGGGGGGPLRRRIRRRFSGGFGRGERQRAESLDRTPSSSNRKDVAVVVVVVVVGSGGGEPKKCAVTRTTTERPTSIHHISAVASLGANPTQQAATTVMLQHQLLTKFNPSISKSAPWRATPTI